MSDASPFQWTFSSTYIASTSLFHRVFLPHTESSDSFLSCRVIFQYRTQKCILTPPSVTNPLLLFLIVSNTLEMRFQLIFSYFPLATIGILYWSGNPHFPFQQPSVSFRPFFLMATFPLRKWLLGIKAYYITISLYISVNSGRNPTSMNLQQTRHRNIYCGQNFWCY